MLKTVAFIKGHKWTSMMVKRVYFGNWLRDYSQAMDMGTLKGIQADTIRILVWVLSFLSFGYATGEFEVTSDRLGVYRPEEHIDNPKDYADNQDARQFDPRLRPPVQQIELDIDPDTGLKNYIANERLGIATSAGYVKFSLTRSIHYGRVYTSGAGSRGKDADLYEALRCLGQALHCLEDFGAHTNYTELALREIGYSQVFTHTGAASEINLRGHRVFPLVTGTFGVVDFLHSVLGEATDHFAQTEVEQMDTALKDAEAQSKASGGARSGPGGSQLSSITSLLSQVPGTGNLARQAQDLQAQSDAQERATAGQGVTTQFQGPPGSSTGPPGPNIPGTNFDPKKTAAQIYPILEFRDKVVKAISATIEKIPGLEALVEKITDTLTLFVLSLLAPFIRPIIDAVSKQLKTGSTGVIDASGRHQYEPWTDPHCTDPTHSLLSKDHFSNILNEPAGQVASTILQYVAPRVIYAWQNPDIPVEQVLNDVIRVFHHPAIRDHNCEVHRDMFSTVERWARGRPDGGRNLDLLLSSQSVKDGKNHTVPQSQQSHSHGGLPSMPGLPNMGNVPGMGKIFGAGSHSKVAGAPWEALARSREAPDAGPGQGFPESESIPAAFPGTQTEFDNTRPPTGPEAGYAGPQDPQNPYAQSQYPSQGAPSQPYYDGGQQFQQGYPGPQGSPYPPGGGYPPPQPQYGYQGQPQYGYDPNAPPPQQQYGYQGPPPSQQYGYGGPPPPYYGGSGQY